MLCPTMHDKHDREVSLLDRLTRGTTDGAILMLPEESSDELQHLQEIGYPFVVVDPREPPPPGIHACVSAMHWAGAKPRDRAPARAGAPPHRCDRWFAGLVRE